MERQIILELLFLTLSGTALSLLFCLFRPLTGKVFSFRWHYYLWLIVLLRLILPVHVDMGIFPAPAVFSPAQTQTAGIEETGNAAGETEGAGTDAADAKADTEADTASDTEADTAADTAAGKNVQNSSSSQMESAVPTVQTEEQSWTVYRWLFLIWLFGALLSLAVRISNYRNFVNYVKADCARVEDDKIQHLAGEMAEKLHVRKWLWIYESPLVASPVLIGVRRPFIVLPREELAPEEAELILRHEFTHLKRHDLWYKWLLQLILCVHWFNPALLLLGKLMDRDCELSCDEAVIAPLTEQERQSYGNILLDTAERQIKLRRSVLSATLLEGRENLKERLRGILVFRKRGTAVIFLSVLLFAAAAVLAACTPSAYRQTDNVPSEDSSVSGGASEEGGEDSGGFLSSLIDGIGGGWRNEIMNASFDISPSEDAWRVYDDEELLAGKDVDGVWRAYFYSGGGEGGSREIQAESFAFCGSDSILIAQAEEPVEITVRSSWELLSGEFKLVYINPDGAVRTLTEDGTEQDISLTLEPGRNVIKMTGRETKLEKLDISLKGLNSGKLSAVYHTEEDEDAGRLVENIRAGTAGKAEFLSALSSLDKDVAGGAFQALLVQGQTFTGPELEEVFLYADEKEAGDILVQAVKDGEHPALSGRTIVELLPYMEENTAVELVQETDKEDFPFDVLQDLLYYLGDDACERCLNHYLDLGNTLTHSQYSDVTYLLSEDAVQRLDRRLESQ